MTAVAGGVAIRTLAADDVRALAPAIARLQADAYPVMRMTSRDAFDAYVERIRTEPLDGIATWAVAERDGEMLGVMHLYDFVANVHGVDAGMAGVGGVAVSLAHKRRGIARAMIRWYLERARDRGAPFAALFPFRLDFYRALGFGYGTPVHRYGFAPLSLRDVTAAAQPRILGPDDAEALFACYERIRRATHGLMTRARVPLVRALRDPSVRIIGVERDGVLRGFLHSGVDVPADTRSRNRDVLLVHDLLAEDDDARDALHAYLRSQADQFERIAIESSDPSLFLATNDPRDGSHLAVAPPAVHRIAETGLGLMYRVVDVDSAIAHAPTSHDPFALRVVADDALLPRNGGARTFAFGGGRAPRRSGDAAPDATLEIGIADLASVVMGALRLRDVVRYGLARVEPAAMLPRVDAAFRADVPPQCATRF